MSLRGLFLADEGEAVTEGEDDFLDAGVGGDVVVEGEDAAELGGFGIESGGRTAGNGARGLWAAGNGARGLWAVRGWARRFDRGSGGGEGARLCHLPTPEGVVGENVAAGTHEGEDGLVVIEVMPLVGVDEDEVERMEKGGLRMEKGGL